MKIIEIRVQDDCFDGDLQKEVLLDEPTDEEFIRSLESAGRLQYFPTFARPFFRLDAAEGFVLKGVQGRKCFQLITTKADPEGCIARVRELVDELARQAHSQEA